MSGSRGLRALPDFPWDTLAPYAASARGRTRTASSTCRSARRSTRPRRDPRGAAEAADAPGYPQTYGTPDLREAVAAWFARRRGVPDVDPDGVLPTIGSKELVAWLPTLLGLGAGDVVVHPGVAYPTYDVGARLAGATPVAADGSRAARPADGRAGRSWSGSTRPATPPAGCSASSTCQGGRLGAPARRRRGERRVLRRARLGGRGASRPVPSILDPRVCGGSHEGLLAVYSLSKQSNLAGYRAAFVAGDLALVAPAARGAQARRDDRARGRSSARMVAALGDDAHVAAQKARYARAGAPCCAPALRGGRVPRSTHSEAGLYLWATRGEDGWATVEGWPSAASWSRRAASTAPPGAQHVRVALTATDERIAAAARAPARR